jgi:hypothetical protein
MNWWGIVFFVCPIVISIFIASGIIITEILKGLWRFVK